MHFIVPLLCLLAVLFPGCVSSKKVQENESVFRNSFYETKLSNGIPVILKQNTSPGPAAVILVIDGGAALIPSDIGGIEWLTLCLIRRQSGAEEFREVTFPDYATYGYVSDMGTVLDKLKILAESFISPSVDEAAFGAVMAEAKEEMARQNASGPERFAEAVKKRLYEGHPYFTSVHLTESLMRSVTVSDLKACHDSLVNAARLKIIAVGNFDDYSAAQFVLAAETTFRKVEQASFTVPLMSAVKTAAGDSVLPLIMPAEDKYLVGCFTVPSYKDADYIPFALATLYFDDMLKHSIKERNQAAESAGTGLFIAKQPVGVISVYKARDTAECKKLVLSAIRDFPDRLAVDKFLNQYKGEYIRRLVSSSAASDREAAQLAASDEYFDDPQAYTKRSALVNSVTAIQVEAAFRKYISEKNIHWYSVN